MKAIIEIECETMRELMLHLSVIRDQINRRTKGWDKDDEPKESFTIEDANCYGSHECKVTKAIDEP